MYDPGLKYALTDTVPARHATPALLHETRRRIEADLADYPGVLIWEERIELGHHVITGTKYPEALARLIVERRRRAALRGEDAA